MKNPFIISLGLFLFLFGLAFAKGNNQAGSKRLPANTKQMNLVRAE